jgi:DNA-binding transcriptional MerR regulator
MEDVMAPQLRDFDQWSGGTEELLHIANMLVPNFLGEKCEIINIRLLRDYQSRGLIGETQRDGREVVYSYKNLVRLLAARLLLSDGWSLTKIGNFFELSSSQEIEDVIPLKKNAALSALSSIKQAMAGVPSPPPSMPGPQGYFKKAARISSMELELKSAMTKLGLPQDQPATEDLTLMVIAPWCQVLLTKNKLNQLTLQDAEDIGRSVTLNLARLIANKGMTK